MTTIDHLPRHLAESHWRTRAHGHDLDIAGLAHIPRSGGAVLALTRFFHSELARVELAIWRHRRRRIRSLVLNGRVEEPRAGSVFRPLRRIRVDHGAGAEAYDGALGALRHGDLVALFPQAEADSPVSVRELKVGAAQLAMEADVPLLPVVVWSEASARERHRERPLRSQAPVRVAFGAPISMQRLEDLRAVTDELRATMQRMLLALLRA
jgi:1-acyl-sn-glycerol-3-phosphate acyltransferase